MDNQEEDPKQTPRKVPDLTFLEQANSEFALAASHANSHFTLPSCQANPSSAPARLSTIDSGEETEENEEDEEISSVSDEDDNDYEYLDSNGFEDEFLDDQESSTEAEDGDFLEEDEIDPDELSYEELIALGEFIGVEKQGLGPSEITMCLRESEYVSSRTKNGTAIDRCVVCQMEFEEGESLVLLRPCDHPYHSDCVTKWLQTKKVCPICGSDPSSLAAT